MDNSLNDKNMFENMFGKNDNLLMDMANAMKILDEPNGYKPPLYYPPKIKRAIKRVYNRLKKEEEKCLKK